MRSVLLSLLLVVTGIIVTSVKGEASLPNECSELNSLYDPLQVAVSRLTAEGMPPPPGWVIKEASSDELGGVPARATGGDEKTIKVDVSGAIEALRGNGSVDPEALINYLMMLLWHEYHHTASYDLPGHPDAPSTYSDICGHWDLGGASLDYLCERICMQEDPLVRAALCATHNAMLGNYNGGLWFRNKKCSPALPRKFGCECCGV